jgi:enoyl-CoA hydratase/carnithine racemase
MTDLVQITRENSIATITLNRPEKKNALTGEMYSAIADLLDEAENDLSIKAIIITGTGDSFTSGNDIKDFLNNPLRNEDAPVFRVLYGLANATVPLIAAVNGMAVGIGTTILMHCDFAYAAPGCHMQMPFINLALVPEAASSLLLPNQVGYRKAAELLMLGDAFTSEEAEQFGVINQVIPANQLMEKAMETAQKLASKAPGAMRQTKALLRRSAEPMADRIGTEITAFSERLASPEAKEVFAAFLEKRPADFSKLG